MGTTVKQIARSIQSGALVFVLLCGAAAAEEPVLAFQRLLAAQDCNVGTPDGKWGPRTSAAAEALSQASGLKIERPVTDELIASLNAKTTATESLMRSG